MFNLLTEVQFWTTQEEISIKNTDYGAFKYHEKKNENSNEYYQSKMEYSKMRNHLWYLTNKRPFKLKEKLKDFEDQILQNKIVYSKWVENDILQIMFCTGMFTNIYVNNSTGDIKKISFDKYLLGKLQNNACISDVIRTRSHIIITYNDNHITLINFNKKPLISTVLTQKLSSLEPKIQVTELFGPSNRRLHRKISINSSGDKIMVWFKTNADEIFPWSPNVKDEQRANVHIYTIYGLKLELQCFRKSEFELLEISFDEKHSNILHSVEQKISRRGTVSVEVSTFEIIRNKLNQVNITSIPLQTHVSCHSFSSDDRQKLAIGCIDGSLVLYDRSRGVTSLVKAAFIPILISWHPSASILLIANERGQIQHFDLSLTCIKTQNIGEDITPGNILDLSSYFKNQPTLNELKWNKNNNNQQLNLLNNCYFNDSLMLLIFEKGPLGILKLCDSDSKNLNADNLISFYIRSEQIEKAINILLTLDWNVYSFECFAGLQKVIQHLFKKKFSPNIEIQIQKTLGSFYAPLRPINADIKTDFIDEISDVTRKFFHLLVRHQLYEKAFCLAIDVADYDLFMDLYYSAKVINDEEMAKAALNKAKELLEKEVSGSENSQDSLCTRSSCSECSDSDTESNNSENEQQIEINCSSKLQKTINAWSNFTITNEKEFNLSFVPPLPVSTNTSTIESDFNSGSGSFSTLCESSVSNSIPPLPKINLGNYMINSVPPLPKLSQTLSESSSSMELDSPRFMGPRKLTTLGSRNPNNYLFNDTTPSLGISPILSGNSTIEKVDQQPSQNKFTPALSNNSGYVRLSRPQERRFENFGSSNYFSSNVFSLPKLHNQDTTPVHIHKTVSLNIPPAQNFLTTSSVKSSPPLKVNVPLNTPFPSSNKESVKNNGEKNVKFSDTVTAFIVPEISRNEKSKRVSVINNNNNGGKNAFLTDPRRELAESLPLCHPDEYLKDFTPISNENEEEEETANNTNSTSKIKVVHFGMV